MASYYSIYQWSKYSASPLPPICKIEYRQGDAPLEIFRSCLQLSCMWYGGARIVGVSYYRLFLLWLQLKKGH